MHVFGGGFACGADQFVKIHADLETFPIFEESVRRNMPHVDYRLDAGGAWSTKEFKGIDLLFGNPRCSGFSCLNVNKKGKHGHDAAQTIDLRQFWRGVRDMRPRLAIFESVQQCASVGRPLLQEMYDDLAGLGYRFAEVLFDNHNTGVPQFRKRFFGVAYADSINFSIEPHEPISTTVRNCIGDLQALPARAFPSQSMNHRCDDTVHGQSFNRPVYNHVYYPLPEHVQPLVKFIKQGECLEDLTDDELKVSPKMLQRRLDGKTFSWAPAQRMSWETCNTIYSRSYVYCHPVLNRPITVREAARLMGFPDSWVFIGTYPFTHIGNGVSVSTGRWIMNYVVQALRGELDDFEVTCPKNFARVGKLQVTPGKGKLVKRFELNKLAEHWGA